MDENYEGSIVKCILFMIGACCSKVITFLTGARFRFMFLSRSDYQPRTDKLFPDTFISLPRAAWYD